VIYLKIVSNNVDHLLRKRDLVSDCCLTPTLQSFSYIMARTSYI